LADTLIKSVYRKQALVPASPWLDNTPPWVPAVEKSVEGGSIKLSWSLPQDKENKDAFHWVVYTQYGDTWSYKILNSNERSSVVNGSMQVGKNTIKLKAVAVSAVDRTGNESEVKVIVL